MSDHRLPQQPHQAIQRGKRVTFEFDGRTIEAFEGETIASALYAAGQRIFTRSFKYHRPRGLLCCAGACPNCMMNVDGTPNVRSCTELVRAGAKVKHQNAWPSLGFDVMSFGEYFDSLMPVGFYYTTFYKPRWVWPYYETVLRNAAGLGKIDPEIEPDYAYDKLNLHCEVAVIGGGPAGLSAALEAAKAGARVVLVESNPELGGHLRFQTRPVPLTKNQLPITDNQSPIRGFELARKLVAQVEANAHIEVLRSSTVFGFYEDNLLGIQQGRREIKLRAKKVIAATGALERPLVFHNNDLPGVLLGSGVQRLVNLYGIKVGERVLVVSGNDYGLALASELLDAGLKLAGVIEMRAKPTDTAGVISKLKSAGVGVMTGHVIKEARGHNHVEGAVVARLDDHGEIVQGSEREIHCDIIAVSVGFYPQTQLLEMAGNKASYDNQLGEFVCLKLNETHFAAGQVNGTHSLDAILLEGRIAGRAATGQAADDLRRQRAAIPLTSFTQTISSIPSAERKKFVCFCEDIAEKDIYDAVAEGFDSIETMKRYSTVAMGPCQGKMCQMTAVGICAKANGKSISETGTTTSRPPYQPVTMGILAGRMYHPHKTIPTYGAQLRMKPKKMTNLGDWMRPEIYTDAAEEIRAVHERAGLIDVSTLGKIDLRGRDVVKLLDKVYINSWSNLKVGRTRYGVMCDDSGIIFDDGTTARLGEHQFYMTTSTGSIEGVLQWLDWWLVGTGWDVSVTNLTGARAAVNLAGPRARDVLKKLTDADVSAEKLPYLGCLEATVAGVPALLMRIGFVGEAGFEIHYPSEFGDYLWDEIMKAGREFGISPFGVEAQRVLRLEKRHIIVGQDTDALSNPLEADLAWAVKFDKPDFLGKRALKAVSERGNRVKLVGIVMNDGITPPEGSQIVENDRSVGRVTSSRFSTTLGKSIAIAWVPVAHAKEGSEVAVRVDGRLETARVVTEPFYDPEGKKLKG
jgi:sarcosine oxidase subunit alpha